MQMKVLLLLIGIKNSYVPNKLILSLAAEIVQYNVYYYCNQSYFGES